MPAGISEDDAFRMALEESTRTDDSRYVRELEDAIELSAAVAAHNGQLPPPPPLPWWAPARPPPEGGYVPPPPAWHQPEQSAAFCAATGWGTEVRGDSPPPPLQQQAPPAPPPPQQQAQATWPEGVPWVPPPFVDLTKDGSDTSDVDDLADFDWTR